MRDHVDLHEEDRRLAQAIARGEETAWVDFYRRSIDALYGFIAFRVEDTGAAEDLLQETLETVIQKCGSFDGRSTLYAWVCGVARHKIQHYYRSLGRRRTWETLEPMDETIQRMAEALDTAPLPDEWLDRRDVKERVEGVLSALPPHYQRVLMGKYVEERSLKDLAEELAQSVEAVESLLARAKSAFRQGFLAMGGVE